MLTTTAPVASPAAAPLSTADFTYLGAASLPTDQTGWESGLTYRPSTDTYFTTGFAGQAPFHLDEIKIPTTPGGSATLVKDWGLIDPAGVLGENGGTMERIEGLDWDAATSRLWITWGSYYNADHTNAPVLAYLTLDTGKIVIHGPWSVPASVGSDNVRGSIMPAPAELQAITGQPFISMPDRGNTAQDESWGESLTSVADPSVLPVGSQTPASSLAFWPIQEADRFDTASNQEVYNFYSNFPRMSGDSVTYITGNNAVNPPTQLSYQKNAYTVENGFSKGEGIYAGAWIQEPGLDGLVYFGEVTLGYGWYGNPNSHDDTSAQGVADGNNLTSAVHPGQPLLDSVQSHGDHADAWGWRAYFVNASDVLNTASKVANGTATQNDLQIKPSSIVNLTTLGGTVPEPNANSGSGVQGIYFNSQTHVLYLLEPWGQVLEWKIEPPAPPPPSPTPAPPPPQPSPTATQSDLNAAMLQFVLAAEQHNTAGVVSAKAEIDTIVPELLAPTLSPAAIELVMASVDSYLTYLESEVG